MNLENRKKGGIRLVLFSAEEKAPIIKAIAILIHVRLLRPRGMATAQVIVVSLITIGGQMANALKVGVAPPYLAYSTSILT